MKRKKELKGKAAQARADELVAELKRHGYLAKWGITDWYDGIEEQMRELVALPATWQVTWGPKKEIQSATIAKHDDGKYTVEGRACMDDADDIIDTIVWEACGGNDFAGSGWGALEKLGYTEEQSATVMDDILDVLGDLDLIYGINETGISDVVAAGATFEQLTAMVEENMDAAEQANTERYNGAVRAARDWLKDHAPHPEHLRDMWACEACGKLHTNEFSRTCQSCDRERESGDLDLENPFECPHCGRVYYDGPRICTSDDCPGKEISNA